MRRVVVYFLQALFVCLLTQLPAIAQPSPTPPQESPAPARQQAPATADTPLDVGEEEVVKVETALVTVPVVVMDRDGRFVANLRQENFRIYEDGVEQNLAFFGAVEKPFNVVLLVDTSPSTRPRQKEIREAATAFIEQLRPEDKIMVFAFDSSIRLVSMSTKDRETLRRDIKDLRWGGSGTVLYGTVDVLLNRLFKKIKGRKALVMLTDGQDNDIRRYLAALRAKLPKDARIEISAPSCRSIPCATYESNMEDVEESDVLIYPIEYAEPLELVLRKSPKAQHGPVRRAFEIGDAYLRELAAKTGGRFYRADGQQNLTRIFTSIADELRHQYSLGFYAKSAAQANARREIRVRVSEPGLVIKTRNSYVYTPPQAPQK